MSTALYRRYRPVRFADMIGQEHVTTPLRRALQTDKLHHAYLFSGPRGCGKTTSARILARTLNCHARRDAQAPNLPDEACGDCPSCRDLSATGGGSLDVLEIDAASHNGVDDARDLRERAVFAPVRDNFKIFIIDEAHMVTPAGFNALLKIVEEPPEHIRFVFATTEPDKVIGTIRSRTHHYPFRLVGADLMTEHLAWVCGQENVPVADGVLPLVVRSGGGSVRDSLSVLDQLIGGADEAGVSYERAVDLLGFTHGALLDDMVNAVAAGDGAAAFGVVDKVVNTGNDPRRFVEDLLERFRDIVITAATNGQIAGILPQASAEDHDRLRHQAQAVGGATATRAAHLLHAGLTEMTGATSPRLHVELLVARLLVPQNDGASGLAARVEQLERRPAGSGPAMGAAPLGAAAQGATPHVAGASPAGPVAPAAAMPAAAPSATTPAAQPAAGSPAPANPAASMPPAAGGTPAAANPAAAASAAANLAATAGPASGSAPSPTTAGATGGPSNTAGAETSQPTHDASGMGAATGGSPSTDQPAASDAAMSEAAEAPGVAPSAPGASAPDGTDATATPGAADQSVPGPGAPGSGAPAAGAPDLGTPGPGAMDAGGQAAGGHSTGQQAAPAASAANPQAGVATPPGPPAPAAAASQPPPAAASAEPPAPSGPAAAGPAAAGSPGAGSPGAGLPGLVAQWDQVLAACQARRRTTWSAMQHATVGDVTDTKVVLVFDNPGALKMFRRADHMTVVGEILAPFVGRQVSVEAVHSSEFSGPTGGGAPAGPPAGAPGGVAPGGPAAGGSTWGGPVQASATGLPAGQPPAAQPPAMSAAQEPPPDPYYPDSHQPGPPPAMPESSAVDSGAPGAGTPPPGPGNPAGPGQSPSGPAQPPSNMAQPPSGMAQPGSAHPAGHAGPSAAAPSGPGGASPGSSMGQQTGPSAPAGAPGAPHGLNGGPAAGGNGLTGGPSGQPAAGATPPGPTSQVPSWSDTATSGGAAQVAASSPGPAVAHQPAATPSHAPAAAPAAGPHDQVPPPPEPDGYDEPSMDDADAPEQDSSSGVHGVAAVERILGGTVLEVRNTSQP